MPRPPKYFHPLREIRSLTDSPTQQAFAKLIGVSAATIQAVENGKMPLSLRLALRVHRATGACHEELLKGGSGRAIFSDGKPFSLEGFREWQRRELSSVADKLEGLDPAENRVQIEAENLAFWVENLVAASGEKRSEFSRVKHSLIEALEQICEASKLESAVEERLRVSRVTEHRCRLHSDWGEAVAETHPRLANSALLSADTRLTFSIEVFPSWNPEGAPPRRHSLLAQPN